MIILPKVVKKDFELLRTRLSKRISPRVMLNFIYDHSFAYDSLVSYLFQDNNVENQIKFIEAFYNTDVEFNEQRYHYQLVTDQFVGINTKTGSYVLLFSPDNQQKIDTINFDLTRQEIDDSPFDRSKLIETEV